MYTTSAANTCLFKIQAAVLTGQIREAVAPSSWADELNVMTGSFLTPETSCQERVVGAESSSNPDPPSLRLCSGSKQWL